MSRLFRPEAVQAVQQQWLGPVQLAQPLALRWLVAAAVLLALATAVFLSLASYTRKAAVPGVLVPDQGLLRLVPAAAATVVERHVAEGQAVRRGDLLFVLAQDSFSRNDARQGAVDRAVDAQRRSLQAAADRQRALADTRRAALDRRLKALDLAASRTEAEAALQTRRLVLARESLARLQSLQSQGFVSEAQLQARQEELLALEGAAQALGREAAALARERAALVGELAAVDPERDSVLAQIDAQIAEATRDGAGLQGERRITLRAPQDGTVHGLLAQPGQSVAPPAALASLLPAGSPLQAELYAPGRHLGPLRVGQAVRLRLEAWPHAKFGALAGVVRQIAQVPLAGPDVANLPLLGVTPGTGPGGEPLYRITVALDALPPAWAQRPLASGLRLQADVMLERRRLVEWLFEPLLGLQQRL